MTKIIFELVYVAIGVWACWQIAKALRRGHTLGRGREVWRNVEPQDFWGVTIGNALIVGIVVLLFCRKMAS